MHDDWVQIIASSKLYEIELIRGLLLENNIENFVLNKQDSIYLIGEIELYVSSDNFIKAQQIILNNNNIE